MGRCRHLRVRGREGRPQGRLLGRRESPRNRLNDELGELALKGAGGEPVLLARTLGSHGVASLPPSRIDEQTWTLEVTLLVARGARTVRVSRGRKGHARIELLGPKLAERGHAQLVAQLRHIFRLDEDLSPFYAVARDDADLAWAAVGAGRMLRSPTVFEDVVKFDCTSASTRRKAARLPRVSGIPPLAA